ncbi:hypothetical protein [Haloglomus litoreum]|uniref:hypothetical protein n=1 Tax=Haloglomus litoreum TaxID=3034026 RepID=UPI0023E87AC3|nr:hypothetical protein [Haloglomus sp. DT116]
MAPTSLLGSLATLLFGVVSVVKPDITAKVVSLEPLDAAGRSEVTTVFGGVFTTLGILGLAGEERPVTLVWIGVVLARIASFRDQEAITADTIVGLLVEIGILGLFLAPEGGDDEPAVEVEVPGADAGGD